VKSPAQLWDSSLPFRVVLATVAASVVILLASGLYLLFQAKEGIMTAKTSSSVSEATIALRALEQDLATMDTKSFTTYEQIATLGEDADQRGKTGNQYFVLIDALGLRVGSADISSTSIPEDLRAQALDSDQQGLWSAPTLIVFSDGRPSQPGIAVAANLYTSSDSNPYAVYFFFPTEAEAHTLDVVTQATWAAGGLLLVAMSVVVYLVARMVLRPVRAAAVAAERLASGHLEDRLEVSGTNDLASLASSMNNMAEELDKKISQLENLSELQQRFVSDVSHELRTPLTTIRMATDVIDSNRDELDPTTARSSELLSKEVDRFEDLLAELLEISRFDAGAAILAKDDVNLSNLVADEIEGVKPLAAKIGSEILYTPIGSLMAEMDSRRVRRIVRNLLTNALEHGEGKPVKVTVGGNDEAVAVAVRDHGVGLDAAGVEKVFTRFWRGDPSRNRKIGGIGLGLAIALEDAHLHGGRLSVWGAPGQGALFRLVLPRKVGGTYGEAPLPGTPATGEGGAFYEG
jgi:two-component system sensor histidine kinase MtrB